MKMMMMMMMMMMIELYFHFVFHIYNKLLTLMSNVWDSFAEDP
jgi:hypothetical protein